ncbi:MAG: hypothetical protein GX089_01695 [Fibrobacter sp.]|jgi:hypothetical protein|nr:hypothetical protein [Fibrobacter sp.]
MRGKVRSLFSGGVLKFLFLVTGGFFLFLRRDRVKALFRNSGFIAAMAHGILLSLIALIYRLITALNWILLQSR